MQEFLEFTLGGISQGMVYAAIALSLVLIWRGTRLLNYGQGEAEAKVAAKSWAKIYDGHSLVTLRRAIDGFDITKQYDRLKKTKVLYVISKTDKLFDLTDCAAQALDMRRAGVDLSYIEMPSTKGHMASHADAAMWAPMLAAFMKGL